MLLRPFSTASSIAFMLSEVFVNEMFLCSSNTLYYSSVNEREIKQTPSKSRTILSLMPSIAERIMFAFARERISVLINSEILKILSITLSFILSNIIIIIKPFRHLYRYSHKYDSSIPINCIRQFYRYVSICIVPMESTSGKHKKRTGKSFNQHFF